MENKSQFKIVNDKGEELICDVLFTFEDNKLNKNYIVFTDNTLDDNGQVKVYANYYDPTGKDFTLGKIETEEEWENISKILEDLSKKIEVQDAKE